MQRHSTARLQLDDIMGRSLALAGGVGVRKHGIFNELYQILPR
jgi:hypothetical protein